LDTRERDTLRLRRRQTGGQQRQRTDGPCCPRRAISAFSVNGQQPPHGVTFRWNGNAWNVHDGHSAIDDVGSEKGREKAHGIDLFLNWRPIFGGGSVRTRAKLAANPKFAHLEDLNSI
jgi:hypothetical protein